MKIKNQTNTSIKMEKVKVPKIRKTKGKPVKEAVQSPELPHLRTIGSYVGECPKQYVIKESLTKERVIARLYRKLKLDKHVIREYAEASLQANVTLGYIPVYLKSTAKKPKGEHYTDGFKGFFTTAKREGEEVTEDVHNTPVFTVGENSLSSSKSPSAYNYTSPNYQAPKILQLVFFPVWKCEVEYNGQVYTSYISDCNGNSRLTKIVDENSYPNVQKWIDIVGKSFDRASGCFFYLWSWVLVCFPTSFGLPLMGGHEGPAIAITIGSVIFHIVSYILLWVAKAHTHSTDKSVRKLKAAYIAYIISYFLPTILFVGFGWTLNSGIFLTDPVLR